jgi:hypothetical protein
VLSRGSQLGKVERRLLLLAKPHDDPDGTALVALREAAGASQRRAVAALESKGLVEVAPAPGLITKTDNPALVAASGRKYLKPRFIRRTKLGDEVVTRYGDDLRHGRRIRWR